MKKVRYCVKFEDDNKRIHKIIVETIGSKKQAVKLAREIAQKECPEIVCGEYWESVTKC